MLRHHRDRTDLKVVALLARQHGLAGLQTLLQAPHYRVVGVATHRLLPKSEDPERHQRPEYQDYVRIAESHHFPLFAVDNKEEQQRLEEALRLIDYDILVSISWRRLIPLSLIEKAQVGAVNLHRGRLPDYPGAEPIKQALMKGDRTIAITAHVLDEQIDHGRSLCFYEHPVAYRETETLEENIARLKGELTDHFGPLLLQALATL